MVIPEKRQKKIGLGGAVLTSHSLEEGVATVKRAFDLGVRYFDTSPMYCSGTAQAALGTALQGVKEPYLIATKLGYLENPGMFHSEDAFLAQFHENLRLLRRENVDTLQLHEADRVQWWNPDMTIPINTPIGSKGEYEFNDAPGMGVLRKLKAEGRCRFIGVSGNTAEGMQRVLEHVEVDTFLLAFNYDLLRRDARKVFSIAEKKGCVRLDGAIFARGLATVQPELLTNPPQWMESGLLEKYRIIYDLQRESGMSLAEMGVRFISAQPEIDTVLIGAQLPEEIEECVRAAERGPLPDDMVQKIEAIARA
jgi:aryl-alcohol dehydrogenase-like predicted oxidoreductase